MTSVGYMVIQKEFMKRTLGQTGYGARWGNDKTVAQTRKLKVRIERTKGAS